jgi:hypothetical protein
MTESSMIWTTNGTGDGPSAGYSSDNFAQMFRALTRSSNYGGVFADFDNALDASGSTSPVAINTGGAVVYGVFYWNTASVNVVIPTPSSFTRIDRIVLRALWSAQTVRLTRIAGTEGAGVPSVTQSAGGTWDLPLFQVSITTGGAITITDERTWVSLIGENAITVDRIGSGAVASAKIASSAVTEAKIATGAVTTAKIADSAVTTAKIVDSAVTSAKLATNSVTASQIAANAVTEAKLAAGAVTSGKIAASAVTAAKIAASAVTATKIASNAVTSAKIATGAVTNAKIADTTIGASKLSGTQFVQSLTVPLFFGGERSLTGAAYSDSASSMNIYSLARVNQADFPSGATMTLYACFKINSAGGQVDAIVYDYDSSTEITATLAYLASTTAAVRSGSAYALSSLASGNRTLQLRTRRTTSPYTYTIYWAYLYITW